MALQEVLEFIYWFMLLQSEDLPAHTEVFMTIFLHNKVQNQDIYPDPEHRNASLGNVAVVYRAPWCNWTSELHLPEIHGTAWNLGWGGKASDEGLILFHCPSLLKWKLHAPAQFEHRGLADDRSKSPSKHYLWNLQNCGNEKNSSLIQVPRNASCKVIKFAFSARNKFMSVLTDMALLPWKCAVLSSEVPPAALQTSKLSCSEVWVWTLQPLSVPRLFANLHILKYFFKGPKPFLDSSLEDFYHYRNCFELKWRHISSTSTECRTFYSENQTKFLSQFLNIP